MARSKGSSSGTLPVALEMLEADHRKVERMFDQYEDEKEESGEDMKRELAQRICMELKVHTQVEHQSAKDLIAQIEGASEIDETFDAKVKVLGEYVKHHVQEEENEMFPQVQSMQEELDELGQEMTARKVELMEEMGMMEEGDAAAMAGRPGSRPGAQQQRGA